MVSRFILRGVSFKCAGCCAKGPEGEGTDLGVPSSGCSCYYSERLPVYCLAASPVRRSLDPCCSQRGENHPERCSVGPQNDRPQLDLVLSVQGAVTQC